MHCTGLQESLHRLLGARADHLRICFGGSTSDTKIAAGLILPATLTPDTAASWSRATYFSKSPLFNQQMLIYGWKMIITVFIIIPALQRERERERACSATELTLSGAPGLMNLCKAQSKAQHYDTNFLNIVLFVNQCRFIMDAITTAACFFFPLLDLIITHYGFVRFPSSQLTSTASWEITKFARKAAAAHQCFTCNLSGSSFPLRQRGEAWLKT